MTTTSTSPFEACVWLAWLAWLAWLLACFLSVSAAQAQRLEDGAFQIDLATMPVLGSARQVGLAGAYTALSEGLDASLWNPAAYGARLPWQQNWFEFEFDFGLLASGLLGKNDFFNNGRGNTDADFFALTFGVELQFGPVGAGFLVQAQQLALSDGITSANALILNMHYGIGSEFLDGQLVVGAGLQTTLSRIVRSDGINSNSITYRGTSVEVGALYRPIGEPWRVGFALRTPVKSEKLNLRGASDAGFANPSAVHQPWELQLGGAWQFGPRPLNFTSNWKRVDVEALENRALGQERCERQLDQWRLEQHQHQNQTYLEPTNPCHALPASSVWWSEETARRTQEDATFEQRVKARKEALKQEARAAWRAIPRRYYLLSAGLLLVGRTPNGVGLDGFLEQVARRSGKRVSLSVRIGFETEVLPHRIKLRFGSYLEPARTENIRARVHGTGGFDIRLFRWDLFGAVAPFDVRTSFTLDVTRNYVEWGVGVGFWH